MARSGLPGLEDRGSLSKTSSWVESPSLPSSWVTQPDAGWKPYEEVCPMTTVEVFIERSGVALAQDGSS